VASVVRGRTEMPDSLKGWAASAFALALITSFQAPAQDGAALATDAIFARKLMMSGIEENMTEITKRLDSKTPLDLGATRFHADMISILMMGFPHLFPASTNQWKPEGEHDPATDTFAAPEIWTRYAEFYAQAAAASKAAYRASRAEQEAELRSAVAELRAACDGCHASFQKTEP